MRIILVGFVTLLTLSCNEKLKGKFSLSGKTGSSSNGITLYLQNPITGEMMDSTIVENSKFIFQTKLSQTPLHSVLRTSEPDNERVKYIWLENNQMFFDATKTNFRDALIKGSESEKLVQDLNKQIDTLFTFEEMEGAKTTFIYDNPSSPVSSQLLSVFSREWGKEKTKQLFKQLSIENKNSEYGERIRKYIELNKDLKVGDLFADFEMKDTNRNSRKLSDLKGKVVLLEFWASWCAPCRKENPNLVKAYKKHKAQGFEVFAVSLDLNKDYWLNAIEKDALPWIHVSDFKEQENEAALIYGVNSIPDNFLIDQNGVIVGRELSGDKLNEMLLEIMSAKN